MGTLAILLTMLAQQMPTPSPRLYVYYALPGATAWSYKSVMVDPPLTLTVDANGLAHLSMTYVQFAFGNGFIQITNPGYPTQINLDTSYASFRVEVPPAPGPCGISMVVINGRSEASGSRSWAANTTGLYLCVPNDAHDGFVWAKSQMAVAW